MEGAVASFIVQKLRELIISEGQHLWAVKGDLEKLKKELPMMQAFLETFNSRKEGADPVLINYILKIQEAAYDTEDAIESYILEAPSLKGCGVQNILESCASFFSGFVALHKIGSKIKAINGEIADLPRIAATYGIGFAKDGEGSRSKHYGKLIELRRSYSHLEEEDVVGFEEDIKKLVNDLLNGKSHVAIWGMGGLGKTTLARKIYQNVDIRRHFDCFAWAYISQKWEAKDVLKSILIELKSSTIQEKDYIHKMDICELAKEVCEYQKQKKCLVVLDDVWSAEALWSISSAFPKGNNPTKTKSKIILTTRNKDVVQHIQKRIGQESILHELQLLNEEESWELFLKKALRGPRSTEMENIGRRIVHHCKGLPLAIVVLGGVLGQKKTETDWEKVDQDINIHVMGGNGHGVEDEGVMQVLSFSYRDLPYYLKPCFLYLGQYPEDKDIKGESLVRKWVAEGIVSPKQYGGTSWGKTLVDIARSYVEELAERCMIQLKLTRYSQRTKSCRLHDLVREFCLLKLDEQGDFLKVIQLSPVNGNNLSSVPSSVSSTSNVAVKARRLAVFVTTRKIRG